MRSIKIFLACLFVLAPVAAFGGIDDSDLPPGSIWYFHADFVEMRTSDAGKGIWEWLDDEVFEEIRDDAGVDVSKEADRITAFSAEDTGVVMVVEGNISKDTQDIALAAAANADRFDTLKFGNLIYYYVRDDDADHDHDDDIDIDGIDEELYFSFAVRNRVIITSRKDQMEEMLSNGAKISGNRSPDGALFVLTAERSLIQAGMDADEIDSDDEGGGFESNVLRNTKQVAMMIADVAGQIAIEARLIATEPEMAESLAGIVRGLIGLASLSDDVEPELASVLLGTKVDVDDNILKISVTLSPEVVVSALEEA